MISNHVLTAEIFKSFTQVLNQITHFLKPQTSDLKVLCVTQILLLLIINKLYLLLRPDRGAEYCNQPVCLSVCLSVCVCLPVSLSVSGLEPLDQSSQNFCADTLWSWLNVPLVALRYVMYFRCYG